MLRLGKVGSGFSGLSGFFRSSNQPHLVQSWVPPFDGTGPVSLRTAIRLGWGTAQLIEGDHADNARGADVGVDGSGNAAAVWFQYDGTRNDIASTVFREGKPSEVCYFIRAHETVRE